jgi:hypothetical protein
MTYFNAFLELPGPILCLTWFKLLRILHFKYYIYFGFNDRACEWSFYVMLELPYNIYNLT